MEREYLFIFGYESPTERESNRTLGTDYESTGMVRILAADEVQAKAWGDEIAERFVSLLHQDPALSWRQMGFAAWIEPEPDEQLQQHWDALPLVRVGEYPSDPMAVAYRA
jgi:hypothetical protein